MSAPSSFYWFTVDQAGAVTIVRFAIARLIKEATVEAVGQELSRLVEQPGRDRILLDMGNVEQIYSETIGKLLELQRKLHAMGGRLALGNVHANLMEVFTACQLERVLAIYDTEQAALASFVTV